jgi:hypothetical protein
MLQVMSMWSHVAHRSAQSRQDILDDAFSIYLLDVAKQRHKIDWSRAMPLLRLMAQRAICEALRQLYSPKYIDALSLDATIPGGDPADDPLSYADLVSDPHADSAFRAVEMRRDLELAADSDRMRRYWRDLVLHMLDTGDCDQRDLADYYGGDVKKADNKLTLMRHALRETKAAHDQNLPARYKRSNGWITRRRRQSAE